VGDVERAHRRCTRSHCKLHMRLLLSGSSWTTVVL
jgi:hypothetical protein